LLSASGFQEPEALLPINNNKSDVHSKDDLEKPSFDVVVKTNDSSMMIWNVEEPLTNVKQLNSNPWGLESGGNSRVDYLNDTVLTTSKVDEGNQTTTSQVGKGDQTSITPTQSKHLGKHHHHHSELKLFHRQCLHLLLVQSCLWLCFRMRWILQVSENTKHHCQSTAISQLSQLRTIWKSITFLVSRG